MWCTTFVYYSRQHWTTLGANLKKYKSFYMAFLLANSKYQFG